MSVIIYSIGALLLTASIVGLIFFNIKSKLQKSEIEKLKAKLDNKNNEIDKLNNIEKLYKKCINDIYYYSEGLPVYKALGDYRNILVDAYSNDFKKGTTVTLYSQITLDEYLKILTTNLSKLTKELREFDSSLIDNLIVDDLWENESSVDDAIDKLKAAWEKVGISEEDARDSYNSGRDSNKCVLFEF